MSSPFGRFILGGDMRIHELTGPPEPALQQAVAEFEATFRSPFGQGRSFHVTYVPERTAFLRTLGDEALCLIAEKDGCVMGVLEVAVLKLRTPAGAEMSAGYLAGIKLRPEARRSITTARMFQKALAWRPEITCVYSVVLDETPLKPTDYTGRVGVPPFAAVNRVAIVRLATDQGEGPRFGDERFLAERVDGIACFHQLSAGRYTPAVRPPRERTITPPAWFVHPSGRACGRFEDRRKVRQLIADDGSELRPAYLSCFAFRDVDAAVEIIAVAQRHARAGGFRALRICLDERDLAAIQRRVGPSAFPGMGATVYGTVEIEPGVAWNLNAAEV